MNGIARESYDLKNERYELRFQRDKDPKYIQLRCVMKKCKFSIWFTFEGPAINPSKLFHARNINLSHSIEEHNGNDTERPPVKASSKPSITPSSSEENKEKM